MHEKQAVQQHTMPSRPCSQAALLYGLAMLCLSGCARLPAVGMPWPGLSTAPIELDLVAPATQPPLAQSRRPVVMSITGYIDARPTPNTEKIGDITSAVNDMSGTELRLRDVVGSVTTAVANQLRASGFQVVAGTGDGAGADFTLSGRVREFSLDIAGRDHVALTVESTLRDAHGGVVWSDTVTEKGDRFAGITGNSRASIKRYLSGALSKVSGKTRDAVAEAVVRASPALFERVASVQNAQASTLSGRLTLTTVPARARVYVADVYYGLTPIALELAPGIHTLTLKLDGFSPTTEKVSVRRGETTELEARF